MNFVKHPSNNTVFDAPRDWDQTKIACDPLNVTRVKCGDGIAHESYWEPTLEELARLRAGARIVLRVYGDGHPPVMIDVAPVEPRPGFYQG